MFFWNGCAMPVLLFIQNDIRTRFIYNLQSAFYNLKNCFDEGGLGKLARSS